MKRWRKIITRTIFTRGGLDAAEDKEKVREALEQYAELGLSIVTLRQLALYDGKKYEKEADFIKTYCDENRTYVMFYPEAPFDRNSYRAEYTYSCEFK